MSLVCNALVAGAMIGVGLALMFVPLIIYSLWRIRVNKNEILNALMNTLMNTGGAPIPKQFPAEAWEPTLCISTGHLTPADAKKLGERSEATLNTCPIPDPLICEAVPFGWLVYTGCYEDDPDYEDLLLEAGYSRHFTSLLKRMHEAGVVRVRFDSDGLLLDQLPKFDW